MINFHSPKVRTCSLGLGGPGTSDLPAQYGSSSTCSYRSNWRAVQFQGVVYHYVILGMAAWHA